MSDINKVVAHFLDGHLLKGTTDDFLPNRPKFHLHPVGGAPVAEIDCQRLKAVFFVRDFNGNPGRSDTRGFGHIPIEGNQGKKIAILFKDGEAMYGYTLAYTPDREGFFVTPADPGSNNIRIYVLKGATHKILVGEKAEAAAKGPDSKAA